MDWVKYLQTLSDQNVFVIIFLILIGLILTFLFKLASDYKTVIKIITDFFKKKKEIPKVINLEKEQKEIEFNFFMNGVSIISYFKQHQREIKTTDVFIALKDEYTEAEYIKRKWNSEIWLNAKLSSFKTGLMRILEDFEDAYVNNDAELLSKFTEYTFWDSVITEGVENYNKICKLYKINPIFLSLISAKHEPTIQLVHSFIRAKLINPIYKERPLILVSDIMDIFKFGFIIAFNDLYEILRLNGKLSVPLSNWEIPNDTEIENELIDHELSNLSFEDSQFIENEVKE